MKLCLYFDYVGLNLRFVFPLPPVETSDDLSDLNFFNQKKKKKKPKKVFDNEVEEGMKVSCCSSFHLSTFLISHFRSLSVTDFHRFLF